MNRIQNEKKIVEQMIRLYCRHKEGNKELCQECTEILNYAQKRLSNCKFGNNKPTCKQCPIHCYQPKMRIKIKQRMQWAGPRMLLYHPLTAIMHIVREL